MRKRHYNDFEPRISYDSRKKRERKSMAYGCLWSVMLIVLIILMAFWWKKEARFAMAETLTPRMHGSEISFN